MVHTDGDVLECSARDAEARSAHLRRALPSALFAAAACALVAAGCGRDVPPPPPCEEACQDGVALRALRETMKFTFNKTLQGKPVGFHDLTTDEFISGSARVHGEATTDAKLGTTKVDLTYVFSKATYFQKDSEAPENFIMVLDGTITQKGTLAVQPSSPTSLVMKSESMYFVCKVYDPPIDYIQPSIDAGLPLMGCSVELNQNGNSVAGRLCGRFAGFDF
jgi:hypothetical protein